MTRAESIRLLSKKALARSLGQRVCLSLFVPMEHFSICDASAIQDHTTCAPVSRYVLKAEAPSIFLNRMKDVSHERLMMDSFPRLDQKTKILWDFQIRNDKRVGGGDGNNTSRGRKASLGFISDPLDGGRFHTTNPPQRRPATGRSVLSLQPSSCSI